MRDGRVDGDEELAGTVAIGNRSDAIMCKAHTFTIRAECGTRGGGGRIHYFASGVKSRDRKRRLRPLSFPYILSSCNATSRLAAVTFPFFSFLGFFIFFIIPPGNKEEFPFYRTVI